MRVESLGKEGLWRIYETTGSCQPVRGVAVTEPSRALRNFLHGSTNDTEACCCCLAAGVYLQGLFGSGQVCVRYVHLYYFV